MRATPVLGWQDLERYSLKSIESALDKGILQGPFVQDFVVNLRYGDASIPVVKDGHAYFLEVESPDEPERIPVDEEDLREYHVDVDRFFAVLASENAIELNLSQTAEGLWRLGNLNRDGTPYVVLFVPSRIRLGLIAAVEEMRGLYPSRPIMLLVSSEASIAGAAHQLSQLNTVLVLLDETLGEDLTIAMPMSLPAPDLELDLATDRARWRGVELEVGDIDFMVLTELARTPNTVVTDGILAGAGGLSRDEDYVRKSILYLRRALTQADDTMPSTLAKQVIKRVPRTGYKLVLDPEKVQVHEAPEASPRE